MSSSFESKDVLDSFIAAMVKIKGEARRTPMS
jgi:hypothetical protein